MMCLSPKFGWCMIFGRNFIIRVNMMVPYERSYLYNQQIIEKLDHGTKQFLKAYRKIPFVFKFYFFPQVRTAIHVKSKAEIGGWRICDQQKLHYMANTDSLIPLYPTLM